MFAACSCDARRDHARDKGQGTALQWLCTKPSSLGLGCVRACVCVCVCVFIYIYIHTYIYIYIYLSLSVCVCVRGVCVCVLPARLVTSTVDFQQVSV